MHVYLSSSHPIVDVVRIYMGSWAKKVSFVFLLDKLRLVVQL
jgi:hypothetical protein